MYISKRAIIDTRKYDVREIFFRYKQGKVWFYEKNATAWKKPKKIVREVLWALMRGIPFPPVYASELQTGELLILDKSDKLRFLLEYLKHREENIRDVREEDDMYFTNMGYTVSKRGRRRIKRNGKSYKAIRAGKFNIGI